MGRLAEKFRERLSDDDYESEYQEQPIEDEIQPIPEEQPTEEIEPETSYEDVPIRIARDIKKKPTPKGYFRTVLFGIPVDLHSLEDYIVKTSPFAIKTLMRFDNARNIEEIKQYSTKTTGKKKLDMKFFMLIAVMLIIVVVGIIMVMKGPEIMGWLRGMAP